MPSSFSKSTQSDWESVAFWQSLCPFLTIGSTADNDDDNNNNDNSNYKQTNNSSNNNIDSINYKKVQDELQTVGYSLIDEIIFPPDKLAQLRVGIQQLHEAGFPATCILLFDALWDLAAVAYQLLRQTCPAAPQFSYDMLAWHVTSSQQGGGGGGGGGFSPHRDRQPMDAASSFDSTTTTTTTTGGHAKFVTQWIAVTPATPQNSCLYCIPATHDPGYMTGDVDDQDPLQRALVSKQDYQHITALPRYQAGQSVLFTHRLIHWGSAVTTTTTTTTTSVTPPEPRMALSFTVTDASWEQPYLVHEYDAFGGTMQQQQQHPPFVARLVLVCAQLLSYYQRLDLPKAALRTCHAIIVQQEQQAAQPILNDNYRSKVFMEFTKAMKEAQQKDTVHYHHRYHHHPDKEDESSSDEEEAILDAMLQAEVGGHGDDFVDDYDEQLQDDNNSNSNNNSNNNSNSNSNNNSNNNEAEENALPPAKRSKPTDND